ncbi:helix-turn-helix transcriptional regulator [Methylopila sp. M107]|uniref:helix-turn-helix transcriptional regulator n=1 Tax=Methylopila sp. M107 TaxID=1101190 RepID=UPI000378158E|nr:helix-turn-helix transcriptional regulator [Methylopila sp. M107]
MTDCFIDRIYEAAALPEMWPQLFDEIASSLGFAGAGMVSVNPDFQRGVASPGGAELLNAFLTGGWQARSLRSDRLAALDYPGFVRDQDVLSDEEIETDPQYAELLRPLGFGYGAGSIVNCPSGDRIAFSFERSHRLGPVPIEVVRQLDEFRPHFARAALFSARLDHERSRAQVEAMASVGLPAAVIGPGRRVLAANGGFEGLTGQVEIGARDELRFVDPNAESLFSIATAMRGRMGDGRSIPLKRASEGRPGVLHVLPVRRGARDIFSLAEWLLVVTPLGVGSTPVASILSGLFDLSPAEARVARGVIGGRTVADIAEEFGLSEATVRTQLRAVFAKTGTSRQSELVSACLGIAAPSAQAE